MVSSIPPASRVMMISSPMPVMPVPMAPNQSKNPIPVKRPMIPVEKMPSSSTDITFIPAIAVPSTMR